MRKLKNTELYKKYFSHRKTKSRRRITKYKTYKCFK